MNNYSQYILATSRVYMTESHDTAHSLVILGNKVYGYISSLSESIHLVTMLSISF